MKLKECKLMESHALMHSFMHKMIDGMQASNVVLAHLPTPQYYNIIAATRRRSSSARTHEHEIR